MYLPLDLSFILPSPHMILEAKETEVSQGEKDVQELNHWNKIM
jgi:hypothetical protein